MPKKPLPSPATKNGLDALQPGSGQAAVKADKGNAGELHQHLAKDDERDAGAHLTDNFGHRIADNQNSLKAGARGPTLLEDFVLREKIFHFDHERIPERIVHARGSGAHGVFECTRAIPELTKADIFQEAGKTCPVFVRFSTVAGGAGSVDTPRDVRGFAVKFYTEAGNWDLVGNNIPVFFIQDAMKFPDLVHSVKMEADRGYPQAASAHDTFWDFIGLMPESFHMIMWAMSDRAIPRSFRMMEGFGVHSFRFVNAKGKAKFVKFHWKPVLGLQSTVWDEAVKMAGADPDYQRRDLFEAIDAGDFPQWDLGVQVFDEAFAAKQPYDVLDATKLIPEEDVPVEIVGRMTLNRNPDNFFAETEQVAFLPSNIIPGIDFSNDPLLQGRLFSYLDTQKSRLGTTNFHQIPINAPKCPFHNFQRDGLMQTLVPKGRANYEPNSLAEADEDAGPRACPETGFSSFPGNGERNDAAEKLRVRADLFADHFSQARLFYRSQTANEQAHIASALVFELSKVTLDHVRTRVVGQLRNIDEDLAKRVAKGLAIDLPATIKPAKAPIDMAVSDALSIQKRDRPDIKGRKIAILFAEGSDSSAISALRKQIEKAGGSVFLVAPRVGGIPVTGGTLKADGQLAGSPSVLFDAVAAVLTEDAAARLSREGAAVQWFMDAFGHCKTIAHDAASQPLLDKAGVEPDAGVVALADFIKVGTRRHWDREPKVRDLA
ncbi:catalase [Sphingopyxis terrae]|uniref:Catalase n=1 Tax=Sphingopyxis terrae subsp. ummariensis TaxID=429001 RepID=A0A1Y6FQ80_9SPHN|nr:catalase [Sphingopyxis terrae]PCF90977.1 catalase HPII [Sphingopyxis terrae subsp. ummariensis]SMQ76406.1 catalase [Sphingopyxis terrae subsp. ummariensis]